MQNPSAPSCRSVSRSGRRTSRSCVQPVSSPLSAIGRMAKGPDQPDFAEIEAAAKAAGIAAAYLPVVSGKSETKMPLRSGSLLDSLPEASTGLLPDWHTVGNTMVAFRGNARGRPLALRSCAATKSAGYDMSGVIRPYCSTHRSGTCGRMMPPHAIVVTGGAPRDRYGCLKR